MNALELRRRTLGKGVYKKTVEGNPAIAQGSLARRYPGITMQGWTEQAQYEGMNLFDISDFETNNKGIIENGTILFKQSLGTVTYYLSLSPGTYSISIKRSGYSGIYIKVNEVAVINNGGSVTFTNNFDVSDGDSVVLEFSEGQNPNGEDRMIFDIMLNSGSTALPYEPYTGGQPSPSPDYPQEITSAGKYNEDTQKYQYEVKFTGANLFNPEKLTGGEIVEYNGVQCYKYTDNSTNFTYIDDFAENTQYCFSVMVLSSEGNEEKNTNIFIVYTDGTRSLTIISHNQLTNAVSLANKTVAMITGDDSWSAVRYIDLTTTTLGIGTEPLPFQPYKEQTVTLTADRPLTKWDRLEKRNGQWGWVYKSGKKVIDGTETYFVGGFEYISEKSSNAYTNNNDMVKGNPDLKNGHCNRLTHVNAVWTAVDSIGFCYNKSQIHMRISNDSLGITSESTSQEVISAMKNYMSQQYNDGNPFVFWYETAEETFVPLSESEQEALNALRTYYPTTMLSNDAGCEMSLTYKTKKSLEVTA